MFRIVNFPLLLEISAQDNLDEEKPQDKSLVIDVWSLLPETMYAIPIVEQAPPLNTMTLQRTYAIETNCRRLSARPPQT